MRSNEAQELGALEGSALTAAAHRDIVELVARQPAASRKRKRMKTKKEPRSKLAVVEFLGASAVAVAFKLATAAKNARASIAARLGAIGGRRADSGDWARAMDDDMRLKRAAQKGDWAEIDRLVGEGASIGPGSLALQAAVAKGSAACVASLARALKKGAKDDRAFLAAAANGDARCLEALLSISDIREHGGDALAKAARGGHATCAAVLIEAHGRGDRTRLRGQRAAEAARYGGHGALGTQIEAHLLSLDEKFELGGSAPSAASVEPAPRKPRRL